MYRVPIVITIFIVILSILASSWVILSTTLQLNHAELINSLIAIFACMGGLISATFIVYSYIQTNKAFIHSQRPFLLIQVVCKDLAPNPQSQTLVPYTFIHYINTSGNEFNDLTMVIKIRVGGREMDISDLFTPKMFMAARDRRHRKFDTLSFLSQRGIDINSEAIAGNPVILSTGYKFSFSNKPEVRKGPEYKWNPQIQHWEIV